MDDSTDKPQGMKRPNIPSITIDTTAAQNDYDRDDPETLRSLSRNGSSTLVDMQEKSSPWENIQRASTSVLRPHPGEEDLFDVENNPFAFCPAHLGRLINPKSLPALVALGGLAGLEKGLQSDRRAGLSADEKHVLEAVTLEQVTPASTLDGLPVRDHQEGDLHPSRSKSKSGDGFADRKRVFGENRLPERKAKSIFQLAWIALQDRVLILLSVAAVVSLALGLYRTFGQTHHVGAKVEWVEGVAIIVAISIVVIVGALNDWQKERQFQKLNRKKEDRLVKVVRSGNPLNISIHDVVVGDIMLLEPGDVIPVDGVFIEGHSLSCDESSATGESDLVKKTPAEDVLQMLSKGEGSVKKLDPFIISGARVLDGVGSFLVTAVGQHSSHGQTMISLQEDPGLTPLQSKLNVLAGYIAKLGSGAGCLLFFVLLIEFLAELPNNDGTSESKGQNFLQILITSITIIVVAVPEGLPLAVTLSLAYATRRMTKENNLVRHLQSCETMGNATVICSDKTGTLTENTMTVVSGALGTDTGLLFGDENLRSSPNDGAKDGQDKEKNERGPSSTSTAHVEMQQWAHVSLDQLSANLNDKFQLLLKTAIAVNTTAFEDEAQGRATFVGTKTETALLDWARRCFALGPVAVERANHPLEHLFPFNSLHKCMGAVVRLPESDDRYKEGARYRLFVKGAPEIVLAQCCSSVGEPSQGPSQVPLTEQEKSSIGGVTSSFAAQSLRTLAVAYRDVDQWPPQIEGKDRAAGSNPELPDVLQDMTWIGLVGIRDPVRQGVPAAVEDCRTASVSVKMVTGDNIETARAVARECGILTTRSGQEGLVMEGLEFRQLTPEDRAAIAKDLCVLARSSPEDKRILVKLLREQGEIVAVTGDGTNDAPALKAADVGFSMGITGTEVAKEASDIILMDDNFTSIVRALGWGRAINDSVKKFLQFQLTVNITAVVITFVSAVSDGEQTSVLNAVQLLWVNLIMDTFAALALATDPPTGSILDRKPESRTASLITLPMWKMIIGQSIYQLIVCFVLWFGGPSFFEYPEEQLRTLIFNVFVFMQIFKLINSRRIDNKLNIFEGLHRNFLFIFMMTVMIAGQLIIIYVGGEAFVVKRLTGEQWAMSVGLGFGSIPIGILIRLFPDWILQRCVNAVRSKWPRWLRFRKKKKSDSESPARGHENYNAVFWNIRDDLDFLRRVRGGRIRALSEALMPVHEPSVSHRRQSKSSHDNVKEKEGKGSSSPSKLSPPSPMFSAIGMPGIVAASVGGLSPVEARPLSK